MERERDSRAHTYTHTHTHTHKRKGMRNRDGKRERFAHIAFYRMCVEIVEIEMKRKRDKCQEKMNEKSR